MELQPCAFKTLTYECLGRFIRRVMNYLNTPGPHGRLLQQLKQREADALQTSLDPLSIPVTRFTTNKAAPMSFIRSLREYLTFLKLQAVNLMAPKPIDVDPFLLLSEDDAK